MISHLLRHPDWKRIGFIHKGRDKQGRTRVRKVKKKRNKWGSTRYKQANSIYSAEIHKKLSHRRGTARYAVSVEIWPIATQLTVQKLLVGLLVR